MKRLFLLPFIFIWIAVCGCDRGQQLITPAINDVVADTPTVEAETLIVYSRYDVNHDGSVDSADLDLVSAALGKKPIRDLRLDVDGNGTIDGTDVMLVSSNFGASGVVTDIQLTVETQSTEEIDSSATEILPTDFVFEDENLFSPRFLLFDDAVSAIKDAEVQRYYFDYPKQWRDANCEKNERERPLVGPIVLFPNRVERSKFIDLIPGEKNSNFSSINVNAEWSVFEMVRRVSNEESTQHYFGVEINLEPYCP